MHWENLCLKYNADPASELCIEQVLEKTGKDTLNRDSATRSSTSFLGVYNLIVTLFLSPKFSCASKPKNDRKLELSREEAIRAGCEEVDNWLSLPAQAIVPGYYRSMSVVEKSKAVIGSLLRAEDYETAIVLAKTWEGNLGSLCESAARLNTELKP